MIYENDPLEIRQVANGFEVLPIKRDSEMHFTTSLTDILVFQSLQEMVYFLEKHFNHRSYELTTDCANFSLPEGERK